MRRITFIALLAFLSMSIPLSSYGRPSPYDDIASIITATENKLHHAKSFEEIENLQYELLRNLTKCLDTKHKGYRYVEGSEEYKRIMKKLDRYNIIYCRSLSRFNPELNTETGNNEKVVRVLAIMRKMENSALTKKEGFNASNLSLSKNEANSANCQIKRNIDGVVLGEATRTEVKLHLSKKNIYTKEMEDGRSLLGKGEYLYGGVIWDAAKYFFIGDILYKVIFLKNYSFENKGKLNEKYLLIRNNLLKKYTKSKLPDSSAEIPNKLFIKGKATTVEVQKEECRHGDGDYNLLRLTYTDIELDKKAKKKDYDDL